MIAGDPRPLPPGWICEIDQSSGLPYFVVSLSRLCTPPLDLEFRSLSKLLVPMPTGYRIRLHRTRKRRGKIRDRRTMPTSPRAMSTRRRQDLLRRRRTTTATTIRSMRRRRRWLGARISERYKDSRRNTIRRSRSSSSSSCNSSRNRSKSSNNSSRSRSRSRSHSNSQSLLRPGPRPQVRHIFLKLSLTAASETDIKMLCFHLARASQVPIRWSRAPLPGLAAPCSAGCSPTRWAVGGLRLLWSPRLQCGSYPELL